jgi:hypothetical protein
MRDSKDQSDNPGGNALNAAPPSRSKSRPKRGAAEPRRGGPRTAKGRRTVSRNAISHGVFAQSPVIPGETDHDWRAFLRGFRASLKPRNPYEEELVRQIAEACWKLRRLDRYERGVIENQFEAVEDADVDHPGWLDEDPERARLWLETNPDGALAIFTDLLSGESETDLDLPLGAAALLAIWETAGPTVWAAWPGITSLWQGTVRLGEVTTGRLRCLVKAAASRTGQSPDAFVAQCVGVLATWSIHKSEYELRVIAARTRQYREAIIPNEKCLNDIIRYRPGLERTRDRALARLEESQLASTDSLPPPVRIDLQEG